jgi:hypothetical protein
VIDSKPCTKCHNNRLLTDFPLNKGCLDGRGSWCRECTRELGRKLDKQRISTLGGIEMERLRAQSYRARNLELVRGKQQVSLGWIHSLKDGPCMDCHSSFPYWCMDFDHVRGVKLVNVSRMVSGSRDRILAEVAKCDLVCACCHRSRTANRMVRTNVAERRQNFLVKLNSLKGNPCLDCGTPFPPEAMDFDHLQGEKVVRVSAMTTWSWTRVLIELSKCELVCANCHRTRTQLRKYSTLLGKAA